MNKRVSLWLVIFCVIIAIAFYFLTIKDEVQALHEFRQRTKNVRSLFVKASTQIGHETKPTNIVFSITNPADVEAVVNLANKNASLLHMRRLSGGVGSALSIAVYDNSQAETNLLFSIVGKSLIFLGGNYYCVSFSDLDAKFFMVVSGVLSTNTAVYKR